MSVRRAQHKGIGLAGQTDVVAIAATAGQEAQILLASKRLSDGLGHGGGSISSGSRAAPVGRPSIGYASSRLAETGSFPDAAAPPMLSGK